MGEGERAALRPRAVPRSIVGLRRSAEGLVPIPRFEACLEVHWLGSVSRPGEIARVWPVAA